MTRQKKGPVVFAVCGSFCTLRRGLEAAQELVEQGWELLPVMSFAARQDSRFGTGDHWRQRLQEVTGHPVLDRRRLSSLPAGSLIVDLASKPGGTDFAAAACLGHHAIHALSLPAVCAPETAGEAVARTVQAILREREEIL